MGLGSELAMKVAFKSISFAVGIGRVQLVKDIPRYGDGWLIAGRMFYGILGQFT